MYQPAPGIAHTLCFTLIHKCSFKAPFIPTGKCIVFGTIEIYQICFFDEDRDNCQYNTLLRLKETKNKYNSVTFCERAECGAAVMQVSQVNLFGLNLAQFK